MKNRYLSLSLAALIAGGCGTTADDTNNNTGTNNNTNNTSPDCLDSDVQGAFDGHITGDLTFCGTVFIEEDVYNSDTATVTVRPGTVFKVSVDKTFELGWAGKEATFNAVGTESNPIIFEGTTDEPGHWHGLILNTAVASNTVLEHVVVRNAGGGDTPAINNKSERGITFKNVTIAGSAGIGLASASFKAGSENLSVTNSVGPAVTLTNALAVTNFPLGGTFETNTKNFVAVDFDAIGVDVTWHKAAVPYLLVQGLYNNTDVTVGVDAGVRFNVGVDKEVQFGWAGKAATLNFNGTEADPIVFRGSTEEPGHWTGIHLDGPVATTSALKFVQVMDAGAADEVALRVESPVTLDNVTLSNNQAASISISKDGLSAASTNLVIEDTTGASAEIEAGALFSLPLGGSYGSGTAYVEITNGGFAVGGQISNLSVPYRVSDNLYNSDTASVQIETGTRLEFGPDKYWELGWAGKDMTLEADGVEFVGATAASGFWAGIKVSGATTNTSFIRNSTISDCADYGLSINKDTGFIFTANTVNDTAGYCIEKRVADTTDYAANNTLNCTLGAVKPD
jgi:hypothetical protein